MFHDFPGSYVGLLVYQRVISQYDSILTTAWWFHVFFQFQNEKIVGPGDEWWIRAKMRDGFITCCTKILNKPPSFP